MSTDIVSNRRSDSLRHLVQIRQYCFDRGCAEFGPTRDQTIAVPANSVRLSRLFVVISRVIGHGSG